MKFNFVYSRVVEHTARRPQFLFRDHYDSGAKNGVFFCMARHCFLCVKMALGSKRLDTFELDFLGVCGLHFYWDEEKWPYTYLSSTTLVYSLYIFMICFFSYNKL